MRQVPGTYCHILQNVTVGTWYLSHSPQRFNIKLCKKAALSDGPSDIVLATNYTQV